MNQTIQEKGQLRRVSVKTMKIILTKQKMQSIENIESTLNNFRCEHTNLYASMIRWIRHIYNLLLSSILL